MRTRIQTELPLAIDAAGPGPIHARIERGLRALVRSGRLSKGTVLPSTRTLALELRVSCGVVVEAYDQLIAEGYLDARARSGTVVAAVPQRAPAPPPDAQAPAFPFDFRPGLPDLSLFPLAPWSRASRKVLREARPQDLGYGNPAGTALLRESLCDYLSRVRGVCAHADEILVCNGFTQGLTLILQTMRSRGIRRLAMEDPCHPDLRHIARYAGMSTVSVPVDKDGMRVDVLPRARAQAVLLTSAHQFPLGGVLSPDRRQWLIHWAQQSGAYVIEDDYDAEYRYDRQPVGALQGLAPAQVIYAGSASKILAPSLRLGWLVVPPALRPAVVERKRYSDINARSLEQLIYAEFLRNGELDRHLHRMRTLYSRRRDVLLRALARHLPEWSTAGTAAGLHLVARLPADCSESQVVRAAAQHAIRVYPMQDYCQRAVQGPALVLGYGSLPESQIEHGICRLAQAIRH